MPTQREPTPELVNTPSPSGKYGSFSAYIDYCVKLVGSNFALGQLMGFTSGTRVADWRKARGGRPSVESCLKLAKLTGDDPHDILIMGGWPDVSDLLHELIERPRRGLSEAEILQPIDEMDKIITRLQYARAEMQKALMGE